MKKKKKNYVYFNIFRTCNACTEIIRVAHFRLLVVDVVNLQ